MFLRHLVDIERQFSSDVGVLVLGVVHGCSVFRAKFRKINRDRPVDRQPMPYAVADVMRQRSNREGKLVRSVRVPEKTPDKITRTNIMGQVREKLLPKRIISEVLNRTAPVRVSVRSLELICGNSGEGSPDSPWKVAALA